MLKGLLSILNRNMSNFLIYIYIFLSVLYDQALQITLAFSVTLGSFHYFDTVYAKLLTCKPKTAD